MEILDRVLVAGITVRMVVGLAVGLALLLPAVRWLRGPARSGGNHLIKRRCAQCAWAGEVSQYNKKCPKCGAALQ